MVIVYGTLEGGVNVDAGAGVGGLLDVTVLDEAVDEGGEASERDETPASRT